MKTFMTLTLPLVIMVALALASLAIMPGTLVSAVLTLVAVFWCGVAAAEVACRLIDRT